jgi:hypothetical protein
MNDCSRSLRLSVGTVDICRSESNATTTMGRSPILGVPSFEYPSLTCMAIDTQRRHAPLWCSPLPGSSHMGPSIPPKLESSCTSENGYCGRLGSSSSPWKLSPINNDQANFAFLPHGIVPFPIAFAVLPEIAQRAFGIFRLVVATATALFPFVRDILMWVDSV